MEEIHKFAIVKELLEEDDPDTEYTQLIDGSNEIVILEGDCYHDKIDHKIAGFFEGLDFAGVNYETSEIGWEESQ